MKKPPAEGEVEAFSVVIETARWIERRKLRTGTVFCFTCERLVRCEICKSANKIELDVGLKGQEDDAVERGDGSGERCQFEIVPETKLCLPVGQYLVALFLCVKMRSRWLGWEQ